MEKIVLKDETELEIENGAAVNVITIQVADFAALGKLWSKMSEANLEEYRVLNDAGLVCAASYNKYVLDAVVAEAEAGLRVTFRLADVNMVEKRLRALEEGQDIQDGAISDLGVITSSLADAQEGGV